MSFSSLFRKGELQSFSFFKSTNLLIDFSDSVWLLWLVTIKMCLCGKVFSFNVVHMQTKQILRVHRALKKRIVDFCLTVTDFSNINILLTCLFNFTRRKTKFPSYEIKRYVMAPRIKAWIVGFFSWGADTGSKLSCPSRQRNKREGDKFYREF